MNTTLIKHGAKKKIAVAAGVSQNTVSAWFTGKHPLTRKKEQAVSAIVGVLGFCPDFISHPIPMAMTSEIKESDLGEGVGL